MTFRKQGKLVFLLLSLLVISNLSCKQNPVPQNASKDSLTVLYLGDERIFHQDYWGMESTYWIFLPLVKNVGDERGEIKPILAESWEHSDDYKTWTVRLRKDIYWHDGVQMTANDVKFTIDLKKKVAGFPGGLSCELIDDFSFKLTYLKPVSNLDTWDVYYPKHLLENLDPENYYDWNFWINPVGNGPYKFVRNVPKTMVEVEVNPNYFGATPKIKKAILKFSQSASLQELLSGNVDALTYVPRDFLFKVDGDDRFTSYYWWGSWVETLFWNHNNPLFKEASVRKALTMGINRGELYKVLNYPDNIPITDVLSTRNQRESSDLPKALAYNPEEARKLLAHNGWEDTNNDGVLEKDGIDFSFTIIIREQHKLMATYIQDNLSDIGLNVDIVTLEGNIIQQKVEKNEFDAILFRFPNKESAVYRIRNYFDDNSIIGYKNKAIDSLLTLIENTGDKQEIDRLFSQLRPIFQKDLPFTLLVPQVQTHIVRSDVKGLTNLYNADPVWSLESLWIE